MFPGLYIRQSTAKERRHLMLLENKNAIVYGAGGAIGGAVARAFAHEGARVFLAGRSPGPVTALAGEITAKGGRAEAGQADVLDAASVEDHFAGVTARAGAVDVSFNAFGLPQRGVQGISLAELTPDAFAAPVTAYATASFVTATAAARHMAGPRHPPSWPRSTGCTPRRGTPRRRPSGPSSTPGPRSAASPR